MIVAALFFFLSSLDEPFNQCRRSRLYCTHEKVSDAFVRLAHASPFENDLKVRVRVRERERATDLVFQNPILLQQLQDGIGLFESFVLDDESLDNENEQTLRIEIITRKAAKDLK